MSEVKVRFMQKSYNLLDYAKHPILHLTDGRGIQLHLNRGQRRQVGLKVRVKLVARDKDGRVTGVRYHDMAVTGIAQFIQANLYATAESIKDTGNSTRAIAANTSTGTVQIVAGTGTSGPTFADIALGSQTAGTSGYIAATVNALSGSSFTLTGTITNTSGGTVNYSEIGITIVAGGWTFLLAHDVFTALPVSQNGTLGTTYTHSFT